MVTQEQPKPNNTLGIVFLTLGVGMTVSMAVTLGPAFLGIGLPFVVLGIIFMNKKPENGE